MAVKAMAYYAAKTAGAPFFPGYLHHRKRLLLLETLLWIRTYLRLLASRRRDERTTEWLRGPKHPSYFLMALQVHDDLQLLRHGRGWRNTSLMRAVVGSFAAGADPGCRLVIKVHPQDRGHRSYLRRIAAEAQKHGVADRVVALQSGALAPVIRNARGLITINSTSGVAAIEAGIPVYVFGNAIYGHPSLVTDEGLEGLARFWHAPRPPDAGLARRFINHLKAHCLLPGGFYDPEVWAVLSEAVAARIASR
jgi:capsular polysaccharide export protein